MTFVVLCVAHWPILIGHQSGTEILAAARAHHKTRLGFLERQLSTSGIELASHALWVALQGLDLF